MTVQGGVTGGERFGPFEVLERLGAGGMAVVHRALRRGGPGGAQEVALKRLLPHLAEDAAFIRAFAREATMASSLRHENICRIHELGRVQDAYFISMEYLEGRDLRALLRRAHRGRRPPPVEVTLSILSQLCAALDHAHTARDDETGEPLGLVHRDVSPANVLVTRTGLVKVIDFGIARATLAKFRTETGRFRGKLGYLPPEAIQGKPLDARSDLFSVGVIAHELLTARPLFGSVNDFDILRRVQHEEIEPPSRQNPECPPALDALVAMALARDPDRRFQSAAAMRQALREIGDAAPDMVARWMEEAAAAEPPPGQGGRATEDLLAELVWGGGEASAPADLPQVPDLSAVVPPPPPLAPFEDEEPEPVVRRQESLELEALERDAVTRNDRRPAPDTNPDPEPRDTIVMGQLSREEAVPADATIKMEQLLRDPAEFETVQIERLEQITAATATVKVTPLERPVAPPRDRDPAGASEPSWRRQTTVLLIAALALLALAVAARAL